MMYRYRILADETEIVQEIQELINRNFFLLFSLAML